MIGQSLSDASTADGFLQKAGQAQLKRTLTPDLDPSRDLGTFEQAAKDQFAKVPAKQDKSHAYFTGPNLDKSCEEIVMDSYAPKLKALDAASKELDGAMAESAHQTVLSKIDGAGVASDINAGRRPTVTAQPGMVGSDEWEAAQSAYTRELGNEPRHPAPHGIDRPNDAQLTLALILGLGSPGAIPQIAGAMFQTADEQRQYLDKLDAAKFAAQTHGHETVLKALESRLKAIETRDLGAARLQTQTNIANANNVARADRLDTTEAGKNFRQDRSLVVRQRLAEMSDRTRRYLISLKDPVQQVQALIGMGYSQEEARDMVNSSDLERLSRRAKVDTENDFLQQTFSDRAEAVMLKNLDTKAATALKGAHKRYYDELVRFMPEKQAMAWALANSLMDYRGGMLDLGGARVALQGERVDEAVAQAGRAAQENADYLQSLLSEGVDEDGEPLTDSSRKLLEIKRDHFQKIADKAVKQAEGAVGDDTAEGGGIGGAVRNLGNMFRGALSFSGNAKDDQKVVNPHFQNEIESIAGGLGMKLGVTTAKSGHRYLTTSGNKSRHMDGNAIDVTSINGKPVTSKEGAALADRLVSELRRQGYAWNTESGHDRAVLWKTNVGGNHFNHLHISNRLRAQDDGDNPYSTVV